MLEIRQISIASDDMQLLTDEVYLLGAGVNQSVRTNQKQALSPPLANNFFKVARKLHVRFRDYDDLLNPLYSYILKYWHKSKTDLDNDEFNLEECFTLIQLQYIEARLHKDRQATNDLLKIQYFLIPFLRK